MMKLCSSALPSNGPCRVPRKSRLYLHCPKALHSPPAPVPRRPQSRPVLCIGQLRLSYDFSPSMQSAATPLVLRLRRLTSRPVVVTFASPFLLWRLLPCFLRCTSLLNLRFPSHS